jgi:hypothetical protein
MSVDPARLRRALALNPLRCDHCNSSAVRADIDDEGLGPMLGLMSGNDQAEPYEHRRAARTLTCIDCGHKTRVQQARAHQRDRILRYLGKSALT